MTHNCAKLQSFSFVAGLLEPFLKSFQGNGPMVSLLCNKIISIYILLLYITVKGKVLENFESYHFVQGKKNDDN